MNTSPNPNFEICEELKDKARLAACYGNQASILIDKGQLDVGLDLLKQALEVFEELEHRMI